MLKVQLKNSFSQICSAKHLQSIHSFCMLCMGTAWVRTGLRINWTVTIPDRCEADLSYSSLFSVHEMHLMSMFAVWKGYSCYDYISTQDPFVLAFTVWPRPWIYHSSFATSEKVIGWRFLFYQKILIFWDDQKNRHSEHKQSFWFGPEFIAGLCGVK